MDQSNGPVRKETPGGWGAEISEASFKTGPRGNILIIRMFGACQGLN